MIHANIGKDGIKNVYIRTMDYFRSFIISRNCCWYTFFLSCDSKTVGIVTIIGTVVIVGALAFGMNWYNTSTASGIRGLKDFKSELTNGIEREITITAEDGREIFHYQGKVDVESDHTDNYIKFESEEGKRYLIYYGIQDTITIIEK